MILGDKETIMEIWRAIESSVDKVKMFRIIKRRTLLEIPIENCRTLSECMNSNTVRGRRIVLEKDTPDYFVWMYYSHTQTDCDERGIKCNRKIIERMDADSVIFLEYIPAENDKEAIEKFKKFLEETFGLKE